MLINATTTDARQEMFLYRKGKYETLPIPAPWERPRAVAINDRGDIAAMAEKPGSTGYVVIAWFAYGNAEDINRHGMIAGGAGEWNGPLAVWQGTRLLAKLSLPQDATSARPQIVSDDGTVVGSAEPDIGPVRWRCSS